MTTLETDAEALCFKVSHPLHSISALQIILWSTNDCAGPYFTVSRLSVIHVENGFVFYINRKHPAVSFHYSLMIMQDDKTNF
jgi:hypothetical protein